MQVDNNKPRRKKQHDQLSGGMELFASPKRTKTDGENNIYQLSFIVLS